VNDLAHVPLELEVKTGENQRLLIRSIPAAGDRTLIGVAPQIAGRDGEWRLKHSGLGITPQVARELARALNTMAATMDGTPVDPTSTDVSRTKPWRAPGTQWRDIPRGTTRRS
jgi:hypothetical protein